MNSKITILFTLLLLTITTVNAQNKGYKKGYIILEGERKQEGYIKYSTGSWSVWKSKSGKLRFKFSPESQPFKAKDDVTGFVIESDSFTIQTNIQVSDMAPIFKRDFAKVIEVGTINLFLHQCSSSTNTGVGIGPVGLSVSNGHGTWILKKDSRKLTVNKIKRQKESLIRLISDNPELAAEIEAKKPSEINIEELVKRYNRESM